MQKTIIIISLVFAIVSCLISAPASARSVSTVLLFIPSPFGIMTVVEIPTGNGSWGEMSLYDDEDEEGEGEDEEEDDDENDKDIRPGTWDGYKAMFYYL